MDHEINALIRIDAWLERGEGGSVPIDLLRRRGFEVDEASTLDDATLTVRLWTMLEAMAGIGLYVWGTNHLSDRELYNRLITEVLPTETFLDPDDPYTGETYDMIGDRTEETNRLYLTYYADEEERRLWKDEFGGDLPLHEPAPFDRDRLLPTMEGRLAAIHDDRDLVKT